MKSKEDMARRRLLATGFLVFGVIALWFASSSAEAESHLPRPNIIVILADDAGTETIGAYGSELRTPRIDALAKQGTRFNNAHSTPLCTPSRVRLLTGKYSFRNYMAFGQLDKSQETIANILKRAGYKTAAFGKWQLSGNPLDGVRGASPRDAGFDEWRLWAAGSNFMQDGCQHWSPTLDTNGRRETFPGEFGSDLVHTQAVDFIRRNTKQPFFLYYPMILPHDPWVATPARRDVTTKEDKFAAMMDYMDSQVGDLLAFVDANKLTDNTMVVFLADNGTHPFLKIRANGAEITGGKGSTISTGTHVPLIIRWPGHVPTASTNDQMVDLTDIFSTIVTAAGASDASVSSDGYDLVRSARDPVAPRRTELFMDYEAGWWPLNPVRYAFDDHWKLYGDGRFFDINNDRLEQHAIVDDGSNSRTSQARTRLESILARMGDMPLTKFDHYFPNGFDPNTVDLKAAQLQLQKNIAYCGDPQRMNN